MQSGPIFVPVVAADSASTEVKGRVAPAAAYAAAGARLTSMPAARATAAPEAAMPLAGLKLVLCMC
ncbi:hypothetical protein ACFOZ0_12255 [Streptomyces yaanensis]|uniref:Uncharacterized protein n=1 Tax=Streptomyces yaanensis TaxID=1142239 RepID=A0ABV7SED5_9ACTN|nr:hypothetical protein [Streptomyces sp. CGMCC 4.7035]WNC03353.1 hypothetical protein Q2K21_14040 [Streptomyces sp. CGMCC 4.7035]